MDQVKQDLIELYVNKLKQLNASVILNFDIDFEKKIVTPKNKDYVNVQNCHFWYGNLNNKGIKE